MELKDTISMMTSIDYKDRFIAEYRQTKIRYEKLKDLNTRIEASYNTSNIRFSEENVREIEMPIHKCPSRILSDQQHIMGEYLHVLELRAVIEGIDLKEKN